MIPAMALKGPKSIKAVMPPIAVALVLLSVASYYFMFFDDSTEFGGEAELVVTRGGNGTFTVTEQDLDSIPELRPLLDEAVENGSATSDVPYAEGKVTMRQLRDVSGQSGAVEATYREMPLRVTLRVMGE